MARLNSTPEAPPAGRGSWPVWLTGWFGLLIVALANGGVRVAVTQPAWGEEAARRIATAILLAVIAAYVWWFDRRFPLPSRQRAWLVGLTWTGLTLAFEFGLGVATGMTWPEMLADYDISRGRVWVLVPLFMVVAPALARRMRLAKLDRQDP